MRCMVYVCIRFVIGAGTVEGTKSPWVYVTIDGALQSFKLFVYSVRHVM